MQDYVAFIFAAAIISALIYALRKGIGSQSSSERNSDILSNGSASTDVNNPANSTDISPKQSSQSTEWWNQDDFPYSAPWWFRYPAGAGLLFSAYWAFFLWNSKGNWIAGSAFFLIGLGLVRELFIWLLIAAVASIILWSVGAAFAAIPVSAAIIIGAMIIAQSMRS